MNAKDRMKKHRVKGGWKEGRKQRKEVGEEEGGAEGRKGERKKNWELPDGYIIAVF